MHLEIGCELWYNAGKDLEHYTWTENIELLDGATKGAVICQMITMRLAMKPALDYREASCGAF